MASSCIVLHVCVPSALRHSYSCDLCDTVFFLIRFWTHSRQGRAGSLSGQRPSILLRKTAPLLKSPTGAFIAAQPRHSHFRRKQKIRTLLLSRKGSDFHGLVQIKGTSTTPWCYPMSLATDFIVVRQPQAPMSCIAFGFYRCPPASSPYVLHQIGY